MMWAGQSEQLSACKVGSNLSCKEICQNQKRCLCLKSKSANAWIDWQNTGLNFMSDYFVPQEEIAALRKFLLDHPLDPEFDPGTVEFDCKDLDKLDQLAAHLAYDELKRLGQLPEGME